MSKRRTAILVSEEKRATETFLGLKNRYDQSIEIAPAPVKQGKTKLPHSLAKPIPVKDVLLRRDWDISALLGRLVKKKIIFLLYFLRYLRLSFPYLKGVSRCIQGCNCLKDIRRSCSRKRLQDLAAFAYSRLF
jgi:hypothetical protein